MLWINLILIHLYNYTIHQMVVNFMLAPNTVLFCYPNIKDPHHKRLSLSQEITPKNKKKTHIINKENKTNLLRVFYFIKITSLLLYCRLIFFSFFYSLWNDLTWRFHTFQWALKKIHNIWTENFLACENFSSYFLKTK